MTKWRKRSAAIMAAVMLVLPMLEGKALASGKAGNLTEAKAREMAEALISDNYGASGVQYAIRDHGQVVLSGGIGVDAAGKQGPVSKDTVFGVGSISKMYVTAATMMLSDAGKVDIDRPLTDYIPEFKMADERYKKITPRMLMNHSAGLYGSHYKNTMLFADNDTENHDTLLQNLRTEKLKSNPGEYSVYANDGFQLLELLVERVSKMSYSEFLARYISTPLGLTLTKTPLDEFDRSQLAAARFPGLQGDLPAENANVIGAGGIYSTAEELTLFSEILTGERPELLSKAAATAMQNPEYRRGVWVKDESNTLGYGLGWDAVKLSPFGEYGINAVTKGGDTILYHSALIALPEEDISIGLLTSGGSSLTNTTAATNILLSYLKDKGEIANVHPDKIFEAPVGKEMPDSFKAYSGLYGTVGSTLHLTIDNGQFNLPALMDGLIPEQTYVYTGEGEFTGKDGSTIISFDDQTNGHTYIRVKSVLQFPGIGQSDMIYYEYEKLNPSPVAGTVADAWKVRNGKTYYAVDEKINSLFYLSLPVLTKKITFDEQVGYANGTRVTDSSHAVNAAEIPIMNGRDAFDLTFSTKGGTEYLQADGRNYISETAVKPIYGGHYSATTIPANGDARWYRIGEKEVGRTMKVDLPQHAGFAVYDADGMPVNISAATGSKTVVLPKGGLIVFGGAPGDVVKITMTSK